MRYAVLEWKLGNDEIADVVGRDMSEETAKMLVRIAPPHLPREIITMDELKKLVS